MSDSRPQHNPHGELGQALDKLPDEEAGIFRNLADVFRRPETVNVFATAAVFVAILFAATEVVDKSKTVGEWVRDFLAAGFVRDGKTLTNEIHPWIAIFFVALTLLQFVLLCSAIANFLVARSLRKERDLFSREKRRLDLESAEIKADRDRATGAVTQLEATRSSLLDQIDGVSKKLEETAADRERAAGSLEQLKAEQSRLQAAFAARETQLRQVVNTTIKSTSKIRNRLFPAMIGAGKIYEEAHVTYHIWKNFDADVRKRYIVRAGAEPLHFCQLGMDCSEDAGAAEMFTDINFRLTNKTAGFDVDYLPTRNEPHSKSACVFFLPRIEPGEAREIEISYQWKGLLVNLYRNGQEEFSDRLKSAGMVKLYCQEVYLEPGTGGTIKCEETGLRLPGMELEEAESYRGWPGWKYSARDIPADLLESEIELTCRWQKS
jgi:hypothetical protein